MPMGTNSPDEPVPTRDPDAPAAGTLMSPQEIAARRAQLNEALAQLPAEAAPAAPPASAPPAAPDRPQPAAPYAATDMLAQTRDQTRFDQAPAPVYYPPAGGASSAPSGGITLEGRPVTSLPDRPQEPAAQDTQQEEDDKPFSHWLHLADGRVVKTLGTYTRHHDTDDPRDPGMPVVAAVANPAYVEGHGDVNQRRRALILELKALGFDLTDLFRNA